MQPAWLAIYRKLQDLSLLIILHFRFIVLLEMQKRQTNYKHRQIWIKYVKHVRGFAYTTICP